MAYYLYIDKVLFPVAPAKLTIKIKNQNETINLINEGEVNLIKSPGLTEIELDELLLPMMQKYPFAKYKSNKFHKPNYYLDKLESWKKSKKPHTFLISRVSPNGKKLLYDTNMQVTIEDYEIIEDVEKYGFDVAVKISMKQYVNWGAKKLVIKKKKKSTKSGKKKKTAAKKKTRKKTKTPAKTYTVKSGDCLYNIAKKQLGNANKWKSIYTLNKKVIEATAKKYGRKSSSNGHWIYPGEKLKLPN